MGELQPSATVIADSVNDNGQRLTTLEVKLHRFMLPEFNTHRAFCLAGDAELEFDLPSGATGTKHRVHRMTIAAFVDRWHTGAHRAGSNPKSRYDTSWVDPEREYTAQEVAAKLGLASASTVNSACRDGSLVASKVGRYWVMPGQAVLDWRSSAPENTNFSIRDRLTAMRIRQLDERTGRIVWSTVNDATYSGEKKVYTLTLKDGSQVTGSLDHQVWTGRGWVRMGDLIPEVDLVGVRRRGTPQDERRDAQRHTKINGRWRSVWQREMAAKFRAEDLGCRKCGQPGRDVHHLVSVNRDPFRAFDEDNVTFLCKPCHHDEHRVQGWQGGTYLYGAFSEVESVNFRGYEPTFDLSISGEFANYIANGVVVHNSRNSASSRAIPVNTTLARLEDEPAVPLVWPGERKGMQGGPPLPSEHAATARTIWFAARDAAVTHAKALVATGVHKSVVNRLLEPFMAHTLVVTATDWDGFFSQRLPPQDGAEPLAQAEIVAVAQQMHRALSHSDPVKLNHGQWHLPYLSDSELHSLPLPQAVEVSAARCARVSYLTQNGVRDVLVDLVLYQRLVHADPPHWSPLEHVATPAAIGQAPLGNFTGWDQLRHRTVSGAPR